MANQESSVDTLHEPLAPDRTALLVIDMQRYFVRPEYTYGKNAMKGDPERASAYFQRVLEIVIPNIQRLLEKCRIFGVYIVYTELGSQTPDGRDLPRWLRRKNESARRNVGGVIIPPFTDPSCRVDDRLAPQRSDHVLQKTTSGPLNSTKLDQTLRVIGIDTIVVTGVLTPVCVAQTAREFADRDFETIVIEDACAAGNETYHKIALETISNTFGTVVSTDMALQLLQA